MSASGYIHPQLKYKEHMSYVTSHTTTILEQQLSNIKCISTIQFAENRCDARHDQKPQHQLQRDYRTAS